MDHEFDDYDVYQHGGGLVYIFFSTGPTAHCGFVFCSPLAGL